MENDKVAPVDSATVAEDAAQLVQPASAAYGATDVGFLPDGICCQIMASWRTNPLIHLGLRMQSMNISLPDPMKQFVDEQIASGRYSSASEYVRELIREDEKRKAEGRLEALLLEGLQGKEAGLTKRDLSAIRKEALAQVKARKSRA
jgi:antitoxin ParD1/3/4